MACCRALELTSRTPPWPCTPIRQNRSMASPHVAGAAALLWSVNPRTKNDVEKLIKEGGHDADVVTLCDACTGTTQHLVYVGA